MGGLGLFGLFAALSAYETAQTITAPRRVASDEDWAAAAAEVRAGYRANDLIVFAPGWVDPVGREHLGDLVPATMAGRSDADAWGRIWEVSIRGARAPETVAAAQDERPAILARRERSPHPRDPPMLVSERAHGRVRVALYQKAPPSPALYDFTARIGDARVTQVPSDGRGDERPCFRDGAGFRCQGVTIEPRTLEVNYRPRRGVLAPVDGNLTTRIEFHDVPSFAGLAIYAGIHNYFARKNGGAPVDFGWAIDGGPTVWSRVANDDGWARLDARAALPGPHTVRFDIKADSAAWRSFGFHAEARAIAEP